MRHLDGLGGQIKKRKVLFDNNQKDFHGSQNKNKILRSIDGIGIKPEKETHKIKPILCLANWRNYFQPFKKAFISILLILIISSLAVPISFSEAVKNKIDILKLFQSGKYLVLFQNNSELRATGGFIGSYGVFDVSYGKISNYYIDGNIYNRDDKYQYMLKKPAPEPLQTFIGDKYWSMHDANWWVDYPESAKQVAWFYENEGGEEVDGVIAMNASLIADLLKIVGPIKLEKYNKTFNSDNFFDILHFYIEKEYPATEEKKTINEPKGIIRDLAPELFSKIQQKEYRKQILSFVKKSLDEKQILLYFANPDLEKLVQSQNWGGVVKETTGDYLFINNSNLGGFKSSLNVKQSEILHSLINNKGKVVNDLKIIRTHTGSSQWPDAENKNYTRILVPSGSKLISAKLDEVDVFDEVEIGSESGKTVFATWINTPPGQSKILEISYKLPFELKSEKYYSLLLQKQSGSFNEKAEVIVNDQVLFNGEFKTDQEIKH